MDKPDGMMGGFGGDAASWMLPLALGALGAYRPQASQGLGVMATMLAHQQEQQHRQKQLAALEQERALDREFRGRQEVREEARTGREVAREQADIRAGELFPGLTGGVEEIVPALPAKEKREFEFPGGGPMITEPAVPGLSEVRVKRAPTFGEMGERAKTVPGISSQELAALNKLVFAFPGARPEAVRPAEVKHALTARELVPVLVGGGVPMPKAMEAARFAQESGTMPPMNLLQGEPLQFFPGDDVILGVNARTGDVVSTTPVRQFRQPLQFHTTNMLGEVNLVTIPDPRNPTKFTVTSVGKDPLGQPRAPSQLTAIEVISAARLLEQGQTKDQVAATIPEFASVANALTPEKFAAYVEGLREDTAKMSAGAALLKGLGITGKKPDVTPPPAEGAPPPAEVEKRRKMGLEWVPGTANPPRWRYAAPTR